MPIKISAYPDALVYLIAIATAGNVLGAILNWALGRFFTQFSHRSWFPVSPCKLAKAEQHYKRYGRYSFCSAGSRSLAVPSLLLPGFLREPLWSFFVLVTLAKGSSYIFVAALVTYLIGGISPFRRQPSCLFRHQRKLKVKPCQGAYQAFPLAETGQTASNLALRIQTYQSCRLQVGSP